MTSKRLPVELLLLIFSDLVESDCLVSLGYVSRVCREWNHAACHPLIWKKVLGSILKYRGVQLPVSKEKDWKKIAKSQFNLAFWSSKHIESRNFIWKRHDFLGHKGSVNAVQIKDKYILSGSSDCSIKIWKRENNKGLITTTTKSLYTFKKHNEPITCLYYSSINEYILSGAGDGYLIYYNLKQGSIYAFAKLNSAIRCLDVNESRNLVTIGTDSGNLIVFDMATGSELMNVLCTNDFYNPLIISTISCDWTSSIISIGSFDGIIQIWDFTSKKLISSFLGYLGKGKYSHYEIVPQFNIGITVDRARIVGLNINSKYVYSIADCMNSTQFLLWDIRNSKFISSIPVADYDDESKGVRKIPTCASFSDGKMSCGFFNGTTRLWESEDDMKRLHKLDFTNGINSPVNALYSSDTFFAAGYSNYIVSLWELHYSLKKRKRSAYEI